MKIKYRYILRVTALPDCQKAKGDNYIASMCDCLLQNLMKLVESNHLLYTYN